MSKNVMSKNVLILSTVIVLCLLALNLWVWQNLPEMQQYPIHWNAQGVADGFGSKNTVLVTLMMMPITAFLMHVLFWVLPKIEPLKANLMKSLKAYNVIWIATLLFLFVPNFFIAGLYMNLDMQGPEPADVNRLAKFFVIGMGVFFVVIGNVLSKVRRNFFVGIKTPWTLSSDMTWEATHRLTARLWVGGGAITIISQAFARAEVGLYILLGSILGGTVIALIYSYYYWRSAPDKKT